MSARVVVVGGGPNGLACAALLAAAGRPTLLLERRETLGGLAGAYEFHPGYTAPGLLPGGGALRRRLVGELGLARHGLRTAAPPAVLAIEDDGPGLLVGPAVRAELADRSAADAEAYGDAQAFFQRVRPFVSGLVDRPAPELAPGGLGDWFGLFGTGLRLQMLARRDRAELARLAPTAVADWVRDRFRTERLGSLLAGAALRGEFAGPWSPGTAANLLFAEALGGLEAEGGGAALVQALESAARTAGAEIRTGAAVEAFVVREGRVAGVRLTGGEEIPALATVSTLDPRRTFLEMLPAPLLPPSLDAVARNWRGHGSTAVLLLALEGSLEFAGRPGAPVAAARSGAHLDDLERAHDAAKYRGLADRPWLDLRVPTLASPELAPPGGHVVQMLVHGAPHDLAGGWDAAARARLAAAALAELGRCVPALSARLVGQRLLAPPDLDAEFGTLGGHLFHGESGLDQMLSLRPCFACSRHATPLRGLFLGGSGTHPGGGLPGASGRLAARAVLRGTVAPAR
ncbi:MAG TPA: FAD-dependent oxidoreductase [Planctomycetota bacterium]